MSVTDQQSLLNRELGEAVIHYNLPEARRLLALGANPNSRYQIFGLRPLIWIATQQQDIPMMKLLLENGANPNVETLTFGDGENAVTPLMIAGRNPELLSLLLEYGADIEYRTEIDNQTALMNAIIMMDLIGAQILVELGAHLLPSDIDIIWDRILELNLFYDQREEEEITNFVQWAITYHLRQDLPKMKQIAQSRVRKSKITQELPLLPRSPVVRRTQRVPSPIGQTIRERRVKRGGRSQVPAMKVMTTFPGGSEFLEAESRFGGASPRASPRRARSPRMETIRRRVARARSTERRRQSPKQLSF